MIVQKTKQCGTTADVQTIILIWLTIVFITYIWAWKSCMLHHQWEYMQKLNIFTLLFVVCVLILNRNSNYRWNSIRNAAARLASDYCDFFSSKFHIFHIDVVLYSCIFSLGFLNFVFPSNHFYPQTCLHCKVTPLSIDVWLWHFLSLNSWGSRFNYF